MIRAIFQRSHAHEDATQALPCHRVGDVVSQRKKPCSQSKHENGIVASCATRAAFPLADARSHGIPRCPELPCSSWLKKSPDPTT